jgi:hypothetical protein
MRIFDMQTLNFRNSANEYFFPLQIKHLMIQLKFVHKKKSRKKATFRTVWRQSCAVFCRNLRSCDLLINNKNLRICDLRSRIPKTFADLI